MPATPVWIHDSQSPETVWRELDGCLRSRSVKIKFLYDSAGQAAKWLALRRACSPSARKADFEETYQKAFAHAAAIAGQGGVNVVSLGCGDGTKDMDLLARLKGAGARVSYTAVDVSCALAQTAAARAGAVVGPDDCARLVCDLEAACDFGETLTSIEKALPVAASARRVVLFFGMLPGVDPAQAGRTLTCATRPGDALLISANLAPGAEYDEGMSKVLPQYDNPHCREWLLSFLDYVGIARRSGELLIGIEDHAGLKSIRADFRFHTPVAICMGAGEICFEAGSVLRLFHSYRHRPGDVRSLLAANGFGAVGEWISRDGEEGVFAAARG
jgi:uncharacterized SAM-dependent methyltransferase